MLAQIAQDLPPLAATIAPIKLAPAEAIEFVASLGYRAVQLSATQAGMRPRELDGSSRRGIAQRLRQLGMVAGGVDLWIPPAHFSDPAQVDRAIDAVVGAIGLAQSLGKCPVSTLLPASDACTATMLSQVRQEIIRVAMQHGVQVADHGIDAVTSKGESGESLAIGIDPPTLIAASVDVCSTIAGAASRLRAFRVVDLLRSGSRGPISEPGDARLEVLPIAAALAVADFKGSLVADARQWADPDGGLTATLARWYGKEEA